MKTLSEKKEMSPEEMISKLQAFSTMPELILDGCGFNFAYDGVQSSSQPPVDPELIKEVEGFLTTLLGEGFRKFCNFTSDGRLRYLTNYNHGTANVTFVGVWYFKVAEMIRCIEEDRPKSEAETNYMQLRAERIRLLKLNLGKESAMEDAILEQMDNIWDKLTPEERMRVNELTPTDLESFKTENSQGTAMSKRRQESIDFERNYCVHYDPPRGRQEDYCALQLGASTKMSRARGAGEPSGAPCIGGHNCKDVRALCPSWERRSLEQAEARADESEDLMQRMDVVTPVVAAWRTWTKSNRVAKHEAIECPSCKGRLSLSQSSYNGHVHGSCETEGCVQWQE